VNNAPPSHHSYGHDITPPRRALLALGLGAVLASCVQAPSRPRLPTWRQIVARGDLIQTGADYERIKRIGQLVLRQPERGPAWQYRLDPSDSQFSTAAAGNGIVVSKGVLKLCENDGQVAAILVLRAETLKLSTHSRAFTSPKTAPEAEDIDAIVIRQLARAGYDPRDALVIAQRTPIGTEVEDVGAQSLRLASMMTALRKLGYQI
jgi:hypothetical protein